MNKLIYGLLGFLSGSYGTYKMLAHDICNKSNTSYFGYVKGAFGNAISKIVHRRDPNTFGAEACSECLSDKIHKLGYSFHKEQEKERDYDISSVVVSNDLELTKTGVVVSIDQDAYNSSEYESYPEFEVRYNQELDTFFWSANHAKMIDETYWLGGYADTIRSYVKIFDDVDKDMYDNRMYLVNNWLKCRISVLSVRSFDDVN